MEYSVSDNLVESDPSNACSPLLGSVLVPAP
jgi:hypothetical protein